MGVLENCCLAFFHQQRSTGRRRAVVEPRRGRLHRLILKIRLKTRWARELDLADEPPFVTCARKILLTLAPAVARSVWN